MTMKKMLLFASMALAAAAFAVPASASAGMFLHQGEPIAEEGETETFTGPVEFTGGVKCESATASIHITTNSASVESFAPVNCATTETLAKLGCVLEGTPTATFTAGTGNGWPIDVGNTDLTITNPKIDNPFKPGCMFTKDNVTGGAVTGTINGENVGGAIKDIKLEGKVITELGEAEVHGTLTAAHENTYELVSE